MIHHPQHRLQPTIKETINMREGYTSIAALRNYHKQLNEQYHCLYSGSDDERIQLIVLYQNLENIKQIMRGQKIAVNKVIAEKENQFFNILQTKQNLKGKLGIQQRQLQLLQDKQINLKEQMEDCHRNRIQLKEQINVQTQNLTIVRRNKQEISATIKEIKDKRGKACNQQRKCNQTSQLTQQHIQKQQSSIQQTINNIEVQDNRIISNTAIIEAKLQQQSQLIVQYQNKKINKNQIIQNKIIKQLQIQDQTAKSIKMVDLEQRLTKQLNEKQYQIHRQHAINHDLAAKVKFEQNQLIQNKTNLIKIHQYLNQLIQQNAKLQRQIQATMEQDFIIKTVIDRKYGFNPDQSQANRHNKGRDNYINKGKQQELRNMWKNGDCNSPNSTQ